MAELSRYYNRLDYSIQDIKDGKMKAGPKFMIIHVFEREKASQVIEVVRNLDPMAEQRYEYSTFIPVFVVNFSPIMPHSRPA